MQTTDVYGMNLTAYNAGKKYLVNQGSARSSKTFSILQLLTHICRGAKHPLIISVVSQTLPHLKRGAIRDFQIFMKNDEVWNEDNWRRGDLIYTLGKCQIEFFSCDDAGKVYGAARDILFVNEANRIDHEIFLQLAIRTRGSIFVDYNPTHEFWAHTELIGRPDVAYIHSTFKDNPYIDPSIVHELIEAGKRNENFRRVFVEGEIGVIEGVVFDNWSEGEARSDVDYPVLYGMDFGFSNDPTALVEVKIDNAGKRLFLKELIYKTGLNTDQIFHIAKAHTGSHPVIGDSSEPRLINELQSKGLNIRPAVKGQGSISAGISLMQSFELVVHPESFNLKKELRNYVFLDSGSKLTIDAFNHCLDSIRYACTFYFDKSNFNMPIPIYKQRQNRI